MNESAAGSNKAAKCGRRAYGFVLMLADLALSSVARCANCKPLMPPHTLIYAHKNRIIADLQLTKDECYVS